MAGTATGVSHLLPLDPLRLRVGHFVDELRRRHLSFAFDVPRNPRHSQGPFGRIPVAAIDYAPSALTSLVSTPDVSPPPALALPSPLSSLLVLLAPTCTLAPCAESVSVLLPVRPRARLVL